ncbi:MAG: hypothetical protein NVSMB12_14080 [Acidimicrobiales bacterium]
MSVNTGARLRVAVAAALVVAVVIALVARGSNHRHPSAAPAPVTAPTTTVTTVETPTAQGAPSTGATTTTVTAGTAAGRPSTGGRAAGPFANGTPAALAIPAGAPLDPLPPPDAGWSPLSVAQGTGNGANGTFTITSATTQVRFRSSAGQFHLFVVDQALGRDATAGYADVDCSGPCSDLQTLSVPKGTYHVEVDADGPWEYSLEQYR